MTVSDMSLDESGSNFAIVAATSLLLDVTRGSSEAYDYIVKRIANILLTLAALFLLSQNAFTGQTVQVRDIVIIDDVEYRANRPLMSQIDSVSYCSLKKSLISTHPHSSGTSEVT